METIELKAMSDDELRKFVSDYCSNQIFCLQNINPAHQDSLLATVFMPIAFGALADYPPDVLKEIGTIYEYYDKAGPRSVNGYPCFVSMRLMWKADWERAVKAIKKHQKKLQEVEI